MTGSRTVYFFSDNKLRYGAAAFVATWLLFGPLVAVPALTALLLWQWGRFHASVVAYRTRRTMVVHSGGADAAAQAKKIAHNEDCSLMSLDEVAALPDGFFHLVDGSVALALVLDDRDGASGAQAFINWLAVESGTRVREGRVDGWQANIVYLAAGKRRSAFMRLAFSIVAVNGSALATTVGECLKAFCALPVEDAIAFGKTARPDPGDVLGVQLFWSWLCACSCCVQRDIECIRVRSSKLRVGFLDMLQAARISREAAWQVFRSLRDSALAMLPWTFFSREIPFPFSHAPPFALPTSACVFISTWGEEALMEDVDLPLIDAKDYVVSSQFRIVDNLGHALHEQWLWELAACFRGSHVVVAHPRSGAEVAFQIGSAEVLQFLQKLVPGAAADPESAHQAWLVASGLWVRRDGSDRADNEEAMRGELHGKGYTVIAPHRLIPAPYWNAVRRYHRALRPWLYEYADQKKGRGKFRMWNDEPVARQMQYALTSWAARIVQRERLVHSSLSLSIFIQKGPGFIYHTDSSPPFDLTFDIVVDHQGPQPRPVYFVRRSEKTGAMVVERLEMRFGEAVLFKGAELTHFGGDLTCERPFHSVQLYTWQYVRD
jgi:hypothetical protein